MSVTPRLIKKLEKFTTNLSSRVQEIANAASGHGLYSDVYRAYSNEVPKCALALKTLRLHVISKQNMEDVRSFMILSLLQSET